VRAEIESALEIESEIESEIETESALEIESAARWREDEPGTLAGLPARRHVVRRVSRRWRLQL
jgi:hypothetical protein